MLYTGGTSQNRSGPGSGPFLPCARYQQKGGIVSFLHVGDTVCRRSRKCSSLRSCLIPEYLGPIPRNAPSLLGQTVSSKVFPPRLQGEGSSSFGIEDVRHVIAELVLFIFWLPWFDCLEAPTPSHYFRGAGEKDGRAKITSIRGSGDHHGPSFWRASSFS